jgi:hypothetical protein
MSVFRQYTPHHLRGNLLGNRRNPLVEFNVHAGSGSGSPPLAANLLIFRQKYLPRSPIPHASHTASMLHPAKSLSERILPPLAVN